MKRISVIAIILILPVFGCSFDQKERLFIRTEKPSDRSTPSSVNQAVTDSTNIHYNKNYCNECHKKIPQKNEKPFLKYEGDFKQLCRCHHGTSTNCSHPSDIEPSDEIKARIPDSFPLKNGKLSCSTCHDIFIQCQENLGIFQKGQMFLRVAPLKSRNSICFECHDKTKYIMYNPHKQLTEHGDIIEKKCLYCHVEIPDVKKVSYKDTKFLMNLESLCMRCHNKSERLSLHDRHIARQPSAAVYAQIKNLEKQFNITLPLTDDGKITCATCHNPHEKGLIPAERAGAKGASKKYRHRLPGNLCTKCHQMQNS